MIPRSNMLLGLFGLILANTVVQAVKFELPAERYPKPSESDSSRRLGIPADDSDW